MIVYGGYIPYASYQGNEGLLHLLYRSGNDRISEKEIGAGEA